MDLNPRDKEYIETYSHKFLTFEDFKDMAKDSSLSPAEKIGFPETYRSGIEELILEDISRKLYCLNSKSKKILDIGSGCSNLTQLLINKVSQDESDLYLCDSEEMLNLIQSNSTNIHKISGKFPENLDKFSTHRESFDGIIIYSVLQHVILEDSIFNLIDSCLDLLKSGGELLIGDIPNISKRDRFFSSEAGILYHKKYTNSDSLPNLQGFRISKNRIDDSIIMAILQRYRNFGLETYILPQDRRLHLSNRREDILIIKY